MSLGTRIFSFMELRDQKPNDLHYSVWHHEWTKMREQADDEFNKLRESVTQYAEKYRLHSARLSLPNDYQSELSKRAHFWRGLNRNHMIDHPYFWPWHDFRGWLYDNELTYLLSVTGWDDASPPSAHITFLPRIDIPVSIHRP